MHFVAATLAVLSECQQLHSQAVVTRLAKCLLPYITTVLPSQSDVQRGVDSSKVKGKGKKRTRGFEGDETFKASRSIIFGTTAAGVVALQVCDGMIKACSLVHSSHMSRSATVYTSESNASASRSLTSGSHHSIHQRLPSSDTSLCIVSQSNVSSYPFRQDIGFVWPIRHRIHK